MEQDPGFLALLVAHIFPKALGCRKGRLSHHHFASEERGLKCLAWGWAGSRSRGGSKVGLAPCLWAFSSATQLLCFPPKGRGLAGPQANAGTQAGNTAPKDILTLSQESAKETL